MTTVEETAHSDSSLIWLQNLCCVSALRLHGSVDGSERPVRSVPTDSRFIPYTAAQSRLSAWRQITGPVWGLDTTTISLVFVCLQIHTDIYLQKWFRSQPLVSTKYRPFWFLAHLFSVCTAGTWSYTFNLLSWCNKGATFIRILNQQKLMYFFDIREHSCFGDQYLSWVHFKLFTFSCERELGRWEQEGVLNLEGKLKPGQLIYCWCRRGHDTDGIDTRVCVFRREC